MLSVLLSAVVAQSEPFFRPVDSALLPQYTDYVYHPMDFSTLERVRCCFAIIDTVTYCDQSIVLL